MADPVVSNVDAENSAGPVSNEREVAIDNTKVIPEIGMTFRSFKEAHEFYTQYADGLGFGVKIKSSSYDEEKIVRRATLSCSKSGKAPENPSDNFYETKFTSKTNCPAHMRLRMTSEGRYIVVSFGADHNHRLLETSMLRFLPSKRRINPTPAKQKRVKSTDQIGIYEPQVKASSAPEAGGYDTASYSKEDEIDILCKVKTLKLGHGDAEAMHRYFRDMQAQNSHFFYMFDLDPLGRLKNVFWADLRSRVAYKYFGDVVTLDTTYLTNGYNVPFAPFLGVNHHGHPVLVGCCLLSEETTENYIWLFNTWLTCMSGQVPKAIVTDQAPAIINAVATVFPNTQHRLCLRHIMQMIPKEFGNDDAIKDTFQDLVYNSLTAEEFDEKWREMVNKKNLHEHQWLKKMYDMRQLWVPAYVKDKFWVNMPTTQKSEGMNAFLDGYVNSKTSLKHFLSQYEMALVSKYEKEAQSDFDSFHKKAHLKTSFYMEEQLAQVYTNEIFKKCQEELMGMMYCDVSLVEVATCASTFEITEHVRQRLQDGSSKMVHKKFKVCFNKEERSIQCICRMFESSGILCKHAISVMRNQGLDEIPQQYLLDRWKKDHHRAYIQPQLPRIQDTDDPLKRYVNVLKICVGFAEAAAVSLEKYKKVINVLNKGFSNL